MNETTGTGAAAPGSFVMRTATEETLAAFLAPLSAAFGEVWTDAELAQDRKLFEVDRIFGAFEGERQVGACGNFTFRMTVPGGELPATGITLVGVLPGERRRGILTTMMRHLVADGRSHAEPVAILWASEGAIYQRYGFGLGSFNGSFELARSRAALLRPAEPEGRVRVVDEADALRLCPPVYETIRVGVPGMLVRSDAWWRDGMLVDSEHARSHSGPKFRVVYEAGGAVEGYAIYRTKAEWDDRGPKGVLTVVEMIGTTPRAERDLWAWLTSLDLFPNVKGIRAPVPHPLGLLLAEPRSMGLTVTDGIWVRLVDLPASLAARRYGVAGTLVVNVADRFLPENAGRWRLAVSADGSGVAERTDAPAGLALDVADLGACYLGAVRPSELAQVGRVVELEPGSLALADSLFRTARAPWCSTPF